jgi:hypothetical protein
MLAPTLELLFSLAALYGLYCAIVAIGKYRSAHDRRANPRPKDNETRITFYEGRGYLAEIYVASCREFKVINRAATQAFYRDIALNYERDHFHQTEAEAGKTINAYCTRLLTEPRIVWSEAGGIRRKLSQGKQPSQA